MIIKTNGGALIRLTRWRGQIPWLCQIASIAAIQPNVVEATGDGRVITVEGAIVHLHGASGGTGGWYCDQTVEEIERLILEAQT